MSLGVAFRAFFAALTSKDVSERLQQALQASGTSKKIELGKQQPATKSDAGEIQENKPKVADSNRSEALTLLSTLQREARFVDLVQESLESFEDAQIGAAAREVLRDCRKTLDRMFAIAPVADDEEGASYGLKPAPSPALVRLVGKSEGDVGTIVHRGWKVTRCEVPKWTGSRKDAWILAPIEVDVT